jgi:ATP-dependent RNA helicase RhlE
MSLVCVDERDFLRDIERLLKREIPKVVIEGYEPDPSIKPEPILLGRGQRGGRGQGQPRQGQPRRGHEPRRDHGQGRDGSRGHGGDARRAGEPRRGGGQHRGQPPHTNPHARDAGHQRGHGHAPRADLDGNRRVERDVDGNRRVPEGPRGGDERARHHHGRPHQPSGQSRPSSGKANVRRRGEREIPAVFGGNRRDD